LNLSDRPISAATAPRILQITPVYAPSVGGIEDVVRALAAGAVRAGWACDVAEVRTSNHIFSREQIDSSFVFRVPLYGHRLVGVALRLRELAANYDLLHVHDPQVTALSANVLIGGRGKPLVLSTHGGFFHTAKFPFAKKLHCHISLSPMLARYNAILASSETDQRTFAAFSRRVELVPNGVNIEKFNAARARGGDDFLRWIYWGRFSRNKRIDQVIHYLALARGRGFPARLLICGNDFDELMPSLVSAIEESGVSDYVEFVMSPSDDELLRQIERSSVFITASEFEGFGLSVVEAMAAGLPVICRDIAPLDGFVASDANGMRLSFAGDPVDVDRLCGFLAQSADAHKRIAAHNRASSERHSWLTAIDAYLRVYRRILEKTGTPQRAA